MNENLIDVLIFIYEHFFDEEENALQDQIILEEKLAEAGFKQKDIRSAFDWLDELAWRQGAMTDAAHAIGQSNRIYTRAEKQKIDLEMQSLLLYLEQSGILDPVSRELVIERAMALDVPNLDIEDIKWIVLLVLLNQPGQESAFAFMEELIYNGDQRILH